MSDEQPETKKPKSRRGFASMAKDKQLKIAVLGGKCVPADKRSFAQNKELAKLAGSKGGATAAANRRKRLEDEQKSA